MKAITLEQVVQNFVPNEPLSGQDLRCWFIDRPRSPRGRLNRYLQSERSRDVKVLLVGHLTINALVICQTWLTEDGRIAPA